MTPEEEAAYRAEQREYQLRMKIADEEWRRAQGFPHWPKWALPALMVGSFVFGMLMMFGFAFLGPR